MAVSVHVSEQQFLHSVIDLVLRTAKKVPVHTLMCLALQSERGRRICAGLH